MVIISGVPIFRIFTVDPDEAAHLECLIWIYAVCQFSFSFLACLCKAKVSLCCTPCVVVRVCVSVCGNVSVLIGVCDRVSQC